MMEEDRGQMSSSGIDKSSGLITLLDGVVLLARGSRTVFLWAVVGAALGVAAIFLPPTYTAETVILPPQSSPLMGGMSSQLESLSSLGGMAGLSSLRSNQELQIALLQTMTVQDNFIQKFHISEAYHTKGLMRTRKALKGHLDVDGTGKDGLIRIRFTDRDAKRAAELANGYVLEFQKFSRTLAVSEASQRRAFFEQQLVDEKEKLTAAEENLRKSQSASGTVALDAQTRMLIQSASTLRAQVSAKEVQVQSIRSYAGAGNVDLIVAEQELAALRNELAKVSASDPDSAAGLLVPKSELPQRELDFIRNTRELKYHETLFAILARQLESARLDEARQGSSSQVIDVARAPDMPSSLSRRLKVVLGILFGAFLGCAIVFARGMLAKLRTEQEVQRRFGEIASSLRGA